MTTYSTRKITTDGLLQVDTTALGEPTDIRTTDPDGASETMISLLRAILYRLENGVDVNIL